MYSRCVRKAKMCALYSLLLQKDCVENNKLVLMLAQTQNDLENPGVRNTQILPPTADYSAIVA